MEEFNLNFNIFTTEIQNLLNFLDKTQFPRSTFAPCIKADFKYPVYTIPFYEIDSRQLFPLYFSPSFISGTFVEKKTEDFLSLIFSVPFIMNVILNYQSAGAEAPEAAMDKMLISLQIGKSKMSLQKDFSQKSLLGKFNSGDFHSANYISSVLASQGKIKEMFTIYPQILINLQLYQNAYDFLKNAEKNSLVNYYLAQIYRNVGETAKAKAPLSKITEPFMLARKELEVGWSNLHAGNFDEAESAFKSLLVKPETQNEAHFGLSTTLFKKGMANNDSAFIKNALNVLGKIAGNETPLKAQIYFLLGNIFFALRKYEEATKAYMNSINVFPVMPSFLNLANTYVKLNKYNLALKIALDMALVDFSSAKKIFLQLPEKFLKESSLIHPEVKEEQTTGEYKSIYDLKKSPSPPNKSERETDNAEEQPAASLSPSEPACPKDNDKLYVSRSKESETEASPASGILPQRFNVGKRDEFFSRAFDFASRLEDEHEKKIHFNLDGINEVEKKFRISFVNYELDSQEKINLVLDCSSFLCFMLKEKHKGNLFKFEDFDPWSWPMTFLNSDLVTYPVERFWRVLWEEKVPEPGWITKYVQYVSSRALISQAEIFGEKAVRKKIRSHPERIKDAETEHKKMLVLCSTIEEMQHIKISQSGVLEIEKSISQNFKPQTPPTSEGWKILRCYGHLFAEILIKEFKCSWFNVDGEDGMWSMHTPWMTFFFPLGKIYKVAAVGESLTEFYAHLINEKKLHT